MAHYKKFSFPVSTLVGSTFGNFMRVTWGRKIYPGFWSRYLLTFIASLILDLFGRGETLIKSKTLKRTKISEPPVFIIGFWRSGTTFLHNLLSEDPRNAYITTYQTIFPHHSLVNSRWLKKLAEMIAPDRRPVDNVKLDMNWPQEEEMGLGNIQPVSFYNYFYFPHHIEEYTKKCLMFENVTDKETRRWEKAYKLLIKKALIISDGKRFISKNPPNNFRIPQILKMFPDAKFIYIYRNPYRSLSSFLPFMKQVMLGVGFQAVDDKIVDDLLLNLYKLALDKYQIDKQLIPQNNLIEIQYEQFKENPLGTVEDIYKKFQLEGFAEADPYFIKYINSQKHQKSGGHDLPGHLVQFVQNNLQEYMESKGYSIQI
jgi:hypothetical protein